MDHVTYAVEYFMDQRALEKFVHKKLDDLEEGF